MASLAVTVPPRRSTKTASSSLDFAVENTTDCPFTKTSKYPNVRMKMSGGFEGSPALTGAIAAALLDASRYASRGVMALALMSGKFA